MNTVDLPHIILGMNKSEINNIEYEVLEYAVLFLLYPFLTKSKN